MSTTIDQRVVEMQFDNRQFESNVKTSLNTIEDLRRGLDLSGASKGLENVNVAAKNMDMSMLERGLTTVKSGFSALEVAGITAIANITNSAVNAGKRIASALTVQPLKDGFQEYETQINSIQTIMANTGKDVKTVNKAIDELNEYADLTIYNFSQMTQNAGMFTAAGVGLEDTMTALKGIGNWAAYAGTNASDMSRATFQLGQALSAGAIRLQDWMSIEKAGGMGGAKYREAFIETAKANGVAVDEIIAASGSFRDSLKENWLTTDIFIQTMKRFADDASMTDAATKVKTFTQLMDTLKEAIGTGWGTSWRIIVGDFEEARKLWTGVSQTITGFIDASSDARNKVLQDWKDLGGRAAIIDSIKNVFNGLLQILTPISNAFKDIMPSITGQKLADFSKKIQSLTEKFKISEETAVKIRSTFSGLFSIIGFGIDLVTALTGSVGGLGKFLLKLADSVLTVTGKMGDYITGFRNAAKETGIFKGIFEGLNKILAPMAKIVAKVVDSIANAFKYLTDLSFEGLSEVSENIKGNLEPFEKIGNFFEKVFNGLSTVLDNLARNITKGFNHLREVLSKGMQSDVYSGLMGFLKGGAVIAGLRWLSGFIDKLKEPLSVDVTGGLFDSIKEAFGGIKETLDGVRETFEAYQSKLKADALKSIATAIAILAGALLLISFIDPDKILPSLGAIAGLMTELMGSMALFDKVAGPGKLKGMTKMVGGMIGIGLALLILAGAMKSLSELDWNEIGKGLVATTGLLAVLVGTTHLMSKDSKHMISSSIGLVVLSGALKILVDVVKEFGNIKANTAMKGIGSIALLLAELALFTRIADLDGMGVMKGVGLMLLAKSIEILVGVLDQFGNIKANSIMKGIGAMGIILAEIAAFSKLTGGGSGLISMGIGMGIIAGTMIVFTKAIEGISKIHKKQIAKGLLTMAGALVIVAGALKLLPNNGVLKAGAVAAIAGSMLILVDVFNEISKLPAKQIVKAFITMAGALGIMAAAVYAMQGALPGAFAIIVVTQALNMLTPVLQTLGEMSWTEIGKGLFTLAAALTIIGVAGFVLGPVVPALLGLGGAVMLLGIGCLAAGAGITAFATGLGALVTVVAGGAEAIIIVIKDLIMLIPLMMTKFGEGIIALAQVVQNGAPEIAKAFGALITALLDILVEYTPKIVDGMMKMINGMLNKLAEHLPEFIQAGIDIILAILQGIADNIDRVVDVVVDIVTKFLEVLGEQLPRVIDAGFQFMIDFLNGLAKSLRENTPILADAINNLFTTIIDIAIGLLVGRIPGFRTEGMNIIKEGFVPGVKSMIDSAIETVKQIPARAAEAIGGYWESFKSAGADLVGGFVKGISDNIWQATTFAGNLGNAAWTGICRALGINSPSRVFMEAGRYSVEGMAIGLEKYAYKVTDASKDLGAATTRAINNSLSVALDDSIDAQPTIRPIFDMTDVQNGAKAMNALFANGQTVELGVTGRSVGQISSMMSHKADPNAAVISAIKDLKDSIGQSSGDSYSINGITYDDGSNITEAVKSLVRAARIERRI